MTLNVQIIHENNQPAFAVIPYGEFKEMQRLIAVSQMRHDKVSFPLEVAEMTTLKKYSLIKAWRVYRGMTQKALAAKMNITQGTLSQIEKSETNQAETLLRVAAALDISPEQLTLDD